MNKIKMTEKEAYDMFSSLGFPNDEITDYIDSLNHDGYIKKTDLEISEKEWQDSVEDNISLKETYSKLFAYMIRLKLEIKRLES